MKYSFVSISPSNKKQHSPNTVADTPDSTIPILNVVSTDSRDMSMGTMGATMNTVKLYRPRMIPITASDTPNLAASLKWTG